MFAVPWARVEVIEVRTPKNPEWGVACAIVGRIRGGISRYVVGVWRRGSVIAGLRLGRVPAVVEVQWFGIMHVSQG